jgi:hypothetical protein
MDMCVLDKLYIQINVFYHHSANISIPPAPPKSPRLNAYNQKCYQHGAVNHLKKKADFLLLNMQFKIAKLKVCARLLLCTGSPARHSATDAQARYQRR